MNYDEFTIWVLILAASMFLMSMAILIYACALLLEIHHKVKKFAWRPEIERDVNGRRRQERL
jgi:hypothetical protein